MRAPYIDPYYKAKFVLHGRPIAQGLASAAEVITAREATILLTYDHEHYPGRWVRWTRTKGVCWWFPRGELGTLGRSLLLKAFSITDGMLTACSVTALEQYSPRELYWHARKLDPHVREPVCGLHWYGASRSWRSLGQSRGATVVAFPPRSGARNG